MGATTSGSKEGTSPRAVLVSVWPGVLLVLVGVLGFAGLLDSVRARGDRGRGDAPPPPLSAPPPPAAELGLV